MFHEIHNHLFCQIRICSTIRTMLLTGRFPWQPWCFTQYHTTRVTSRPRYKFYSYGLYYDLSKDPLEKYNLAGSPALDGPLAHAAQDLMRRVLDSLSANMKLPWEFHSISARKNFAEEAESNRVSFSLFLFACIRVSSRFKENTIIIFG